MEDDIPSIQYNNLNKPYMKKIIKTINEQLDNAIDIRDEIAAKNTELRRALNIVEHFLRKTKLPCYGGMAINAHLPADKKFYDFSKTIPDYDFYSPNASQDADKLVVLLKKENFKDIGLRFGVNEGTYKVFVNYHGVADITLMVPWLFNKLFKDTIVEDGIHYVSADYLRKCMYLELSRPLGEVERWEKVYKRLLLLNIYKPVKSLCDAQTDLISLPKNIYSNILKYVIDKEFIFAGTEIADIYKNPNTKTISLLKTSCPIVAYADEPDTHLSRLKQLISSENNNVKITIVHWKRILNLLPEMYGIKINGKICIILIEKLFCHSYNTITIPRYGKLLICSLDSVISLYFLLSFRRDIDDIVPETALCFAHRLVEISTNTRDKNKPGRYPSFVLTCSGHQASKETLFAAKAERVKAWRIEEKHKRKTRRLLEKMRNKTKKNN